MQSTNNNGAPVGDDLADALLFYLDSPSAWAEDILGIKLLDWQEAVLTALSKTRFVSVRSGHGVGKSTSAACAILWFLTTHPFSKVICTAPTKEQLFDVLWAECAKWIRESTVLSSFLEWRKDQIVVREHPEEWFAVARTAEVRKLGDSGLTVAEGLQGRHAASILYVLDEASGIDEAIMSTIDGSLTTKDSYVLMIGNPTRTSGTFYDSFHDKCDMWANFHVSSEDYAEHMDPGYCQRMLRKYGSRDHPLYLIRVRGEFPPSSVNAIFSLQKVIACQEKSKLEPSRWDGYEFGLDVARYGNNKTVLTIKHGPVVEKQVEWVHKTTMETVGIVIQYIKALSPSAVRIDMIGVGAGVYDRLKEMGFRVVGVNNGAKATEDEKFVNLRAETYWNLRELIEMEAINLPMDKDLRAEMMSVTYKITPRGKIQIESKEDLMKRGVASPDKLDSLVLACMANIQPKVRRAQFVSLPFMAR